MPLFLFSVFKLPKARRNFASTVKAYQGPASAPTSQVTTEKGEAGWRLLVDGEPYYVKGVGCNSAMGRGQENYLLMAKELGANTVRTFGVPQNDYLDQAPADGLKVNV